MRPRKVFLSYAQDDGQRFARELSAQLTAAGHEPWRDQEQLTAQGGVRWVPELTRQLLTADVVVVLLTPGACMSPYVEAEWMKAMDHRSPVVPAIFLECGVPLPLTPLQHIDFRSDPKGGFTALLERLDRLGVETERDRRTLDALRARRTTATGDRSVELDTLIRDLNDRIESHPADVRDQADRLERGLAEERERAAAEAARPTGPGVRRYGRRPLTALDAFRDRVEQQTEIATALFDPKMRMVTVLGRGGMGKTALACYVLAQMEAGQGPARDSGARLRGVAYLQHTPTHPITLDRVLLYIARVLPDEVAAKAERVFGNRDLSTEDRVDRFLDLITDGLVVALLDNSEDLLDERGHIRDADINLFVRRVLAGSGALRLLVTARAAITLPAAELRAERQVVVRDGLPPGDAVALLKEFDPNQQLGLRDAGEAELLKLVQLTHGIPRALELVANILQGDDDGNFVLDIGEVATGFYSRETVVQKLVEVNYAKLRPEARCLVEALSVYGRPVPPVAIDFMLQPHVPGLRLGEVLQPLVNARLVSVERGRDGKPGTLGLHPIDRDFLYQRLPADGTYSRAGLQMRAAGFYRTQRTHGPSGWRDLAQLLPQLLEFEHLVQAGAYDQASILLGEYASAIAHCGHPTHCRDLFLKLPERFASDAARVSHALTSLIWKAYLGPVADGLKTGEEALRMALEMGDVRMEVRVREQLVYAYRYAHDGLRSSGHAERIAERIDEAPEPLASELAAMYQPAFDLVLAYTYG
ncbi:MAG: TIR domain-containing protein, partial [Vicinamibacterales bacterium]